MPIVLVQAPTTFFSFDDQRFPDRDEAEILEHLVHYCTKFEPLPAITVKVDTKSAIVIRGHKYLVAARALQRPNIRAVVATPPSSIDEVNAFLAKEGVARLDWDGIRAAESAVPNPKGWHVFFLERSLTAEEKVDFRVRVARLFDCDIPVDFDDAKKVAEFEAATPVGDHAWASKHLATFVDFSQTRVRIVSFQGRKLDA